MSFLESCMISSHRYFTNQPTVTESPLESVLGMLSLWFRWLENNISRPPLLDNELVACFWRVSMKLEGGGVG